MVHIEALEQIPPTDGSVPGDHAYELGPKPGHPDEDDQEEQRRAVHRARVSEAPRESETLGGGGGDGGEVRRERRSKVVGRGGVKRSEKD